MREVWRNAFLELVLHRALMEISGKSHGQQRQKILPPVDFTGSLSSRKRNTDGSLNGYYLAALEIFERK